MPDASFKEKRKFSWKGLPEWLRIHLTDSQRYLIFWILAGMVCGVVAVSFHLAIDALWHLVRGFSKTVEGAWGLLLLAFAPAVGGLLTGLIFVYVERNTVGSGIPQTKARYYRDFGVFTLREAFWRFVAGTLSTGMGMSLGREGPTVHICAAISSKIGQVFGLAKKRVQAMVPVGMGAGIAAAFNTPLAAMFFVYEELLGDFSSKALFGILVAVVIAAAVERLFLGTHPAFDILLPEFGTEGWMFLCVLVGPVCGVMGHLFVWSLLELRMFFKERVSLPLWLKPALGGLGVGLVGVAVMVVTEGHSGVFGIGYDDLEASLNGRMLLPLVLMALFVGKFAATLVAYASGGSGGLFAPVLFLGGILGALVGVFGQMVFGWESDVVGAVALLGMGAFFAAVIRCPLTSIMIIFELTGNYSLILPLMVGNISAYLMASKWQPVALYDALLLQDKINLRKVPSYQGEQDWRNLPVSSITTFEPVTVMGALSAKDNLMVLGTVKHHAYPVISGSNELLGMVTHAELVKWAEGGEERTVGDVVSGQKTVTVEPGMSIREVAHRLVIEDVMQVPVVKRANPRELIGIVTLHDIARQQNAIVDGMYR